MFKIKKTHLRSLLL